MLKSILHKLNFHPRALLHNLLTYRRFLGTIKPDLMRGREEESLAWLRSLNRVWQVARLRAPLGRRLVVIAPHPDDESIGAGGLLLAHRDQCQVHLVNVFRGEGGGRLPSSAGSNGPCSQTELVAARRKEMAAAGALLGVSSIGYLDFQDGATSLTVAHADELGRVIKRLRPDVVLLPWYLDNHGDHRATNILYSWSCQELDCMVLGYEIWTPCPPNATFDITEWLEKKVALVKTYETQLATVDYVSFVRGLARTRGFLHDVGTKRGGAAEAYFSLPNRDYCDLVTSLYGERGRLKRALSPF